MLKRKHLKTNDCKGKGHRADQFDALCAALSSKVSGTWKKIGRMYIGCRQKQTQNAKSKCIILHSLETEIQNSTNKGEGNIRCSHKDPFKLSKFNIFVKYAAYKKKF